MNKQKLGYPLGSRTVGGEPVLRVASAEKATPAIFAATKTASGGLSEENRILSSIAADY